jgi:integrase
VCVDSLTPSDVREWWAALATDKPVTAAGAYRLLATLCNTAVVDQLIARSPCRVKGVGVERSPERPAASVAEVTAALEVVPERLRPAFMLAAWCQLRRGEILGLQRRDVDVTKRRLRIERSFVVDPDGATTIGPPKTEAGRRTVAIPAHVATALSAHLHAYVAPQPAAWLFAHPRDDGPVSVRILTLAWNRARSAVGRPDLLATSTRGSLTATGRTRSSPSSC